MEIPWSLWIERAINNDQDACAELYKHSYNAVYQSVRIRIKDEDAARSIAQNAYLKIFRKLSTLEKPESFIPWARVIARNTAIEWLRRKKGQGVELELKEEILEEAEDYRPEHLPETVMDRKEIRRLVDEILDTLPEKQRMVFILYHLDGYSEKEIADRMGISENTVKSCKRYAQAKIDAQVEKLKKKGVSFYSLAPVPFLLWLCRSLLLNPDTGNVPMDMFQHIMAEVAPVAAGTAAAGAAAASGAAAGTAAGSGQAITAAAGAGKAGGIFASLGAKIVAGVAAVAVAGGVGTGIYLAGRGGDVPAAAEPVSSAEPAPTVAETTAPPLSVTTEPLPVTTAASVPLPSTTRTAATTTAPVTTATAPPLSTRELLNRFLEEVLIPQKGIYNIEQPSYYHTSYSVYRTVWTVDPGTGAIRSQPYSSFTKDEDHAEIYAEYLAAKETTDISGLYFTDFSDYDSDGEPELLVGYGENGVIWLELFNADGGKVSSVGKLSFADLDPTYGYRNIDKVVDKPYADAPVQYLVIRDDAQDVKRFYKISSNLELISSLAGDISTKTITEFFYDTGTTKTYPLESISDTKIYLENYGGGTMYGFFYAQEFNNSDRTFVYHFDEVGGADSKFLSTYYKKIS